MKIEAIFGGLLVLIVLAVAGYTLLSTNLPPRPPTVGGGVSATPPQQIVAEREDPLCQCYDGAFKLAGANVGVMSSQYRTGFEQCRAQLGAKGGDAWTAGWNARLSSKPYESSCRRWLRHNG